MQWSVQQDDKGNPLKDANGRFLKKDIIGHTMMQKQAGWEKGDVNIASFAFLPAKITAAVGKALNFLNSDDTPHQITVTNGPRTEVFLRGQRVSLTLDKPGEYNYICGLHPNMKGVIEAR